MARNHRMTQEERNAALKKAVANGSAREIQNPNYVAKNHRMTQEERTRKKQQEQAKRAVNQDAAQVRDAFYSSNSRANQKEAYKKQQERAARQDNAQYTQPYYDSNQRAQKRRLQAQEEQNRYNAKATRDEATHRQEAHQNRVNRSSTRGYEKEEAAFNKGRNPGADRMTGQRLRNQRALDSALNKARRSATNLVGKSSVPSTNPTAAGSGDGRTWKNHKYTAKVIGKNGKVRYIYGDAKKGITGSDLKRAGEELKKANIALNKPTTKATLNISQDKAASRNTGGADRVHHPIMTGIKDAANNAMKSAGKAVSDGTNFVSSKMKELGNTAMSALSKIDLDGVEGDRKVKSAHSGIFPIKL